MNIFILTGYFCKLDDLFGLSTLFKCDEGKKGIDMRLTFVQDAKSYNLIG
jgi:hypothetical protein